MLARYICVMLALELAAYVAVAYWLHFLFGSSYPILAIAAVAFALVSRLAVVAVSTSIGHFARSPRPETLRESVSTLHCDRMKTVPLRMCALRNGDA